MIDGIAKTSKWKLIQSGLYFEEYIKNGKKKYRLKPKMYFSQLCVWLIVTIVAKLIMLAVLKITEKFLENFGTFILKPFSNGKVRLVMVMVFFPVILNGIYFWIGDNILKCNPEENDTDFQNFYLEEKNKEANRGQGERGNLTHNVDSHPNNNSIILDEKHTNSVALPGMFPRLP